MNNVAYAVLRSAASTCGVLAGFAIAGFAGRVYDLSAATLAERKEAKAAAKADKAEAATA